MAEGKFGLKDGTDYLEHYNWEPGMNDDLAYADRAGWQTSVAMLTGGCSEEYDLFGGPEVGNQYDLDPMGEERGMTTFSRDTPEAMDHIGMAGEEHGDGMQEGEVTTTGGKRVNLTSPQTYNRIAANKKNG